MPLPRHQLELGIDSEAEDWMRQAYQLLGEHPDLAYSSGELAEAILGTDALTGKLDKLNHSLDVLAEIGAFDKAEVKGTDYYAFREEFDTNTWERDLSKV
ncbi:MAG: hypothetical protein O2913_13430 [Chloroflexi bacterium]|nr:hypothetical protein [Chloroflexota bacterium]